LVVTKPVSGMQIWWANARVAGMNALLLSIAGGTPMFF
jgi:hypothetical protein